MNQPTLPHAYRTTEHLDPDERDALDLLIERGFLRWVPYLRTDDGKYCSVWLTRKGQP